MGILMTAVRWLGTVGFGWVFSDVYNEYTKMKTTNPQASVVDAVTSSAKSNWIKWLAALIVAIVVYSLIKPKR